MATQQNPDSIREAVREHYAAAARQAQKRARSSCCSSSGSDCGCSSPALYDLKLLQEIPEGAALASLGCGNPLLLAELQPGETVLDLGSGGGIDVLLSARRVGPAGKAYGLDMTDEMLELARANARQAGATNVEFLKGHIEAIPLPDATVDVIISNCVINLSADKGAVFGEAHRVLRPGGRLAVADIVVQGPSLSEDLQRALGLWSACLSGALTETDYRAGLQAAGFVDIEIVELYEAGPEDLPEEIRRDVGSLSILEDTRIISAAIKARKPGSSGAGSEGCGCTGRASRDPVAASGEGLQASCCGAGGAQSDSPDAGERPTPAGVRAYFERVAGEWDDLRQGFFTDAVRDEVLRWVQPDPSARIADIGCGTGFLSAAFAPQVAEVHAVDASVAMLDQARANLAAFGNVRYHPSDGMRVPLPDESVDAAVANMYLHHTPDPQQTIAEMVRILRPGGRLVITDLDEHTEGWMREVMADVWLGFARDDVHAWLERAGLQEVAVECPGQTCCSARPAGGRASISIFLASGVKG